MDRRMQLQKTKTYVLRNGGNYELSYRREPMMANNTHDVDTLKAGAYFMKYAEVRMLLLIFPKEHFIFLFTVL